MSKISSLTNMWEIVKEVDLRPIREGATQIPRIAIVGDPGSGRSTLADQMRSDPSRPGLAADTPVNILDFSDAAKALNAELIILMMDSRKSDTTVEQEWVVHWHNTGKRVLVFINQFSQQEEADAITPWTSRGGRRVVWGSAQDSQFLVGRFAPAVIEIMLDRLIGLGRFFPLFRVPIAHYMINDTCVSNAAYALGTGLAETIAILDIPIVVADSIILTKTQAYLAYKLGLTLGYSTQWQDYLVEFGGVLGGGFVWRQIARTLVGLIPVWGILPKTAIAYAGTYVVGNAILQWYLTGKHVSKKQMRYFYTQALERGKHIGNRLIRRVPRPRLPKRSESPPKQDRRLLTLPKRKKKQDCPACQRSNSSQASYCQFCGTPLGSENIHQADPTSTGDQTAPEDTNLNV